MEQAEAKLGELLAKTVEPRSSHKGTTGTVVGGSKPSLPSGIPRLLAGFIGPQDDDDQTILEEWDCSPRRAQWKWLKLFINSYSP